MAGLAALQLVDSWATEKPLPSAGLEGFQDAIHMMDTDAPERPSLSALVDALRAESAGRDSSSAKVLASLDDYTEVLTRTAEWRLAIDACRTLIRHARAPAERAILPQTCSRLGACLAKTDRWQAALEVLEVGRVDAYARRDTLGDLIIRITEAELEADRGNVVAAEALLDEISVEATHASATQIRARAFHGRGRVANSRGENARALSLYATAIEEYEHDASIDRALGEMAAIWLHLGFRDVACRVLLALEASGIEPLTRAEAAHLIRTAAPAGREPDTASLPDHLQPILGATLTAVARVSMRWAPGV
jgi:hypothetical protein